MVYFEIKKKYTKKIAVITNGALLYDKSVKKELSKSDIILPTLDVPNEKLFRIVNRPHPDLSYQKILDGMESFFSEFQGEIWLEVMLIKDLNDKTSILQDLANIIIKLNPDRIYVNVPIRPPTESWVKIPSKKTIQRFKNLLKDVIDISIPEKGVFTLISNKLEEIKEELIETIKRHPMRKDQIQNLLIDKGISEPIKILNDLEQMELIQPIKINDVVFFEWKNYQFK